MPFDCTPVIEQARQLSAVDGKIVVKFLPTAPISSPILNWYANRDAVNTAATVLLLAREVIADERHWCKGTLARGWLDAPVPVNSRFARRFCAVGAIYRAGRELGLPVKDAYSALEWQTIRSIPYWNDARRRMHAEVVAAFDAAIYALEGTPSF